MADFPQPASDGIRVGWRGLFVFIWSAPRAVGFWGGLRSIIVGIYWQKWVAAVVTVAWCGDAADRYIAPAGQSGSIDVCVPPKGSTAPPPWLSLILNHPVYASLEESISFLYILRILDVLATLIIRLRTDELLSLNYTRTFAHFIHTSHFYEKLGKLYFLVAAKHAAQ